MVIIFAAVNGYLKDVEVGDVKEYEKELYEYMTLKNSAFLKSIAQTGKIDDGGFETLRNALRLFTDSFIAKKGSKEK